MTTISSIPIRAGHLSGRARWDSALQTYVAALDVFEGQSSLGSDCYPPPTVRHGTRFAEFVTFDSLVNHLIALGLPPDGDTLAHLYRLGELVAEVEGQPEFVGFTVDDVELADHGGDRYLFLRTPSGAMVEINPRLVHPDHRLRWGDTHPATIETGRLICQLAFVRQPGQDLEAFALALTHEHLCLAGPDFSLSATSACDWFLTDSCPSTTLSASELARLRSAHGLVTRRERTSIAG